MKKEKEFKPKKILNMTNRRVVIRLIMSYTISGFCWNSLCITIKETNWDSESMLAGILPIWPDRKEILLYQAFYFRGFFTAMES